MSRFRLRKTAHVVGDVPLELPPRDLPLRPEAITYLVAGYLTDRDQWGRGVDPKGKQGDAIPRYHPGRGRTWRGKTYIVDDFRDPDFGTLNVYGTAFRDTLVSAILRAEVGPESGLICVKDVKKNLSSHWKHNLNPEDYVPDVVESAIEHETASDYPNRSYLERLETTRRYWKWITNQRAIR